MLKNMYLSVCIPCNIRTYKQGVTGSSPVPPTRVNPAFITGSGVLFYQQTHHY